MKEQHIFISPKQLKTRGLMIKQAMQLYAQGFEPSVAEVAAQAGVSRATAYRYFPTQSALVAAMVEESLGPVMNWEAEEDSVSERILSLFGHAWPRIFMHEGVLRSALKVSLDQWAKNNDGNLKDILKRGNRLRLLRKATQPLEGHISPEDYEKLIMSLSVIYGTEALVVLKDIGGSSNDEVAKITEWMAMAVLEKILKEQ